MPYDPALPTLVARFGALGDMVMLTPALEVLSGRGAVPCEVVTSLKVASELYAGVASVGAVTRVHSKRTPYWLERSQQKFVRAMRGKVARRQVGSALSFTVVPRVPWLFRKAGLPSDAAVTHQDLPRGELEHDIAYGERLVRALVNTGPGESTLPPRGAWPVPRLATSDSERDQTEAWLRTIGWRGEPIVLLQTQSRKARRGRWPDPNWTQLVRLIRARLPEARVLFTGVPSEEPTLLKLVQGARVQEARVQEARVQEARVQEARVQEARVQEARDPAVATVAGAMTLRRLVTLASLAHSMVSLDTGPAHIAAAVGCPLVVLFGTEHPLRTRPTPRQPGWVAEVSALPEAEWPDSRQAFAERHRMQDIPLGAVAEAWDALRSAADSSA